MDIAAQTAVKRAAPKADTRIASYLLTDYLERLGVEVIFGLCGHTVIGFLDALGKSRIRFISTRHEQIAAHAADGYARASGKVGVLMTHLGPGLTNAATGVANAALDSIPMVVIAGDIPSYYYGRHPHQEVNLHQDADQFQIYRPFCKRVYRVDNVRDLPRIVERAFHLAQSGRPGPVLVDVPMDIFSADLEVDAFATTPPEIAKSGLDPATAARIVDALATSRRPVLYAGGGVLSARATKELQELAEALQVPVAHTLDGEGLPAARASAAAWPVRILGHADREREVPHRRPDRRDRHAPRRGELELLGSAFHLLDSSDAPDSHRRRSRGDSDAITRPSWASCADAKLALAALADEARGKRHADRGRLTEEIARGRKEFASNWADQWSSSQYPLRPERILSELRRAAPADAFIVTDVGWNKNGVGQQFPIDVPGTFITPSGLATMGFGPAAALGVKVAQPKRHSIALIGDGGFSTNPSVIATAMEAGLHVIWVVMDNSAFGTIAGLEEMHYGTTFGCMFECDGKPYRVDYAAMARSFGADGYMVTTADELRPALESALASGRPSVIQVPMENAPTPTPGHWDINDIYRRGE